MILQSDTPVGENGRIRTLGRIAIYILQVCLLLVTAFLAYQGVRFSFYSSTVYEQPIYELRDSTFAHLLFLGAVCLGAALFYKILERLKPYQEKICTGVLIFAAVWLLTLGFLYVREHPYYPVGDQLNATAGAAYARQENFLMFDRGGYIGLYEQQKGLVFLYEILFTLFGDFSYRAVSGIHVCLSVVTLVSGYGFLKIASKKPFYRILYCGMMMLCMPYFLYLPYAYGDLPSIAFSSVLFWALAAYGKRAKKRYIAIGAVSAALALLVRMNILIVLIAVAIGMILLAVEKGSLRPILAGLCVILAAWGSVRAVDAMYEWRSGYESGVGIPSILWVAMGLQETEGNPGVYNRYQQSVFEECGFEQGPAKEIGKEYIKDRLREMLNYPGYTKDFFVKKVKMQWLEPLFESLYATGTFDDEAYVPWWAGSLYYGKLHDTVWKAANYYQSMIYLAAFAFVAGSLVKRDRRTENGTMWIPLIAVVGGFLFSMIWENQCRYVLPYYVYLVMYAPLGIGRIAEAVSGIGTRITGKSREEDTEESAEAAA
ncbi:MAG: hypothetical protein J6C84_10020 [Lachnospiraceae bacterium]|nr:hypothetical protein [Lachnospiraceae bacterium]